MMQRMAAVAAVCGLLGAGAPAVSAQTACQQIQITTTRTASPGVVTPLDAIAFPVPLTPATSTVVRQILVCPPGSTLAPVFAPVPVVIGSPVAGSPVFETPVIGAPFFTVGSGNPPSAAAPAAPRGADGAAAPSRRPVLVGTVPEDTVRGLATQGARYDRMVLTVAGTAAAVEETTDARGARLTTFRLDAEGTSVGVVLWGRPTVRAGEAVRVSGPFFLSTPFVGPSGNPWHNVIEADLLER
jgi:hypothetical protein